MALLDEMLAVVIDTGIPDEQVGPKLRGGIGMEHLRSRRSCDKRPARTHPVWL